MLYTKIEDYIKMLNESEVSDINFSEISNAIIEFWTDIKKLGTDINEFKNLFIEKFGENVYSVFQSKLSSDQLSSNYEDSNTELESTELVNKFDEIIEFCNSYLLTYSSQQTNVSNEAIFKPKKTGYDITQSEKSLASAVAPLIQKMEIMPLPDLKTEFTNILKDPNVSASEQTRRKWFDTISKATNKNSLMMAITNLYLKAAKLGLTESADNKLTDDAELRKSLSEHYYFTNNNMTVETNDDNSIVISGFPHYDLMSVPAYIRNVITEFCERHGYKNGIVFKNKMVLKKA